MGGLLQGLLISMFVLMFSLDNIKTRMITMVGNGEDLAVIKKEELTSEEVIDLQQDMLDLFGEKNRPRPEIFSSIAGRGKTSSAKKYMLDLYRKETTANKSLSETNDTAEEEATNKADTIVSFMNHGYVPRPNISDEQGSMYFDVSSNLVIETTLASELRIYLDVNQKTSDDNVFSVTVYQIIEPRKRYLVLSSRVVNATISDWHEFDIIKATKEWKDDPYTNKGVLITCKTMSGKLFDDFAKCGLVDFKGPDEQRPFLVSFYQSGNEDEILAEQIPESQHPRVYIHQRIKRSLRNLFPRASDKAQAYQGKGYSTARNRRDDAQHCRRHQLYIAFKDLGWSDWIIAPDGFPAMFCNGECNFPLGRNMNASNHAIIQTLVHLMTPEKIPSPCCAPLRLQPLQVLYLDDNNNVIMKRYANMIVKDCGCQ